MPTEVLDSGTWWGVSKGSDRLQHSALARRPQVWMTLCAPVPLPLPALNHNDDCGPLYSRRKEDMKARGRLLKVWRLQEALAHPNEPVTTQ